MRDLELMADDELRRSLGRGVDRDLRRELEAELAWREHTGRHVAHTFAPAWLLASTIRGRRK